MRYSAPQVWHLTMERGVRTASRFVYFLCSVFWDEFHCWYGEVLPEFTSLSFFYPFWWLFTECLFRVRPFLKKRMDGWTDGWSGQSRGRMPGGARGNLLPRQCLVYSGVAGFSSNRALSFRPVDNSTGKRIRQELAASLGASPYWVDFYHPNQPRTEPGTSDL